MSGPPYELIIGLEVHVQLATQGVDVDLSQSVFPQVDHVQGATDGRPATTQNLDRLARLH